jgi:hypothetical protein
MPPIAFWHQSHSHMCLLQLFIPSSINSYPLLESKSGFESVKHFLVTPQHCTFAFASLVKQLVYHLLGFWFTSFRGSETKALSDMLRSQIKARAGFFWKWEKTSIVLSLSLVCSIGHSWPRRLITGLDRPWQPLTSYKLDNFPTLPSTRFNFTSIRFFIARNEQWSRKKYLQACYAYYSSVHSCFIFHVDVMMY